MPRPASLIVLGLCLPMAGAATAAVHPKKPVRVALDYRRLAGAERCPSRMQLEKEVAEILGRPPFAKSARRTVQCTLRGEKEALHARVQLIDGRSRKVLGVRELSGTGPSCEELGSATAFAIALAIDPLAKPPPPRPSVVAAAGAAGASASGAAGAAGATGAGLAAAAPPSPPPPSPPPPRPPPRSSRPEVRLVPDAGSVGALALAPLLLAPGPDAGPLGAADAGVALPPPDGGAGALLPAAALAALSADSGVGAPSADAGLAMLEPDAGPEALAPDAGVAAEGEAAAAATEPSSGPSADWRPIAGVGAVGTAGMLPGIAGGVLVHAGAASSDASVEVEGRWLPGTTLAFGAGSIATSEWTAALVGCARFGSWGACGLAQAGQLEAQGQGYSQTEEVNPWVVAVGARAQWEWVFADPVGLRIHLDGTVNLIRPRLLVDSQVAWTAPPAAVWLGGGLFGRF